MPVLIPIVAAVAAYAGSAFVVGAAVTAGLVTVGSIAATVVGVVAGAVIGAAVGAIGAAVTGGDIGKGALWGAVGGAVAGGFAGFSATGSAGSAGSSVAVDQSAMHSLNGQTAATAPAKTSSLGLGSLSEGTGMLGASVVQAGGQAIAGHAEGEAMEEAAKKQAEAADKARKEEFEQRMKEIYANHEQRMSEIRMQADNSLALADKNNAAAMEQLNTRIGAEKEAVQGGYAREDEKVARFNSSIMGTDANLFNRPTFSFNNTGAGTSRAETEFDSGFDQAVAEKTQQQQQPTQDTAVVVAEDPNDPNKLKVA